jgi:uncharacterized SAM-binding protein YcdF (DUF218 family)
MMRLGWLSCSYEQLRLRQLPRDAVLVVPGHAVAGDPDHQITEVCAYRVRATERLALSLGAQAVIFSGWGGPDRRTPEAWQMRDLWGARQIALLTEPVACSTAENAVLSAPLVTGIGDVRDLIVTTHYWHWWRTRWMFRAVYAPMGVTVHTVIVWPSRLSRHQVATDRRFLTAELRALPRRRQDLASARRRLANR